MNFTRLSKLSNLVTNDLKRKPTIIFEPNRSGPIRMFGMANDLALNIDGDNWTIPNDLQPFLKDLAKSSDSIEEKILKIYIKLCEDYTYDDNVLSYIQKNDDETFFLPDEYGRSPDSAWKEKRKLHKRRNCFEISRILAKSINEILKQDGKSGKYDVCILWDEAVTHYFVGLVCNEYCLSLDLDDFTQIKDLTRIKTGLTIEGIKILDDPSYKFSSALRRFNDGRSKIAKKHIEDKRKESEQEYNANNNSEIFSELSSICSDDVQFLRYAIQILKEDYNLDSAGIFEYLKEIIDTKISARSRKKVWKEIENNPGTGIRYTRCLIVKIDDVQYIIDVTKEKADEIFREFNPEEMHEPNAKVKPFNLGRNWDEDPYDGR